MAKTPDANPPVSFRPPKSRRAEFERMVDASGLSANAFIAECVFGRTRHRPAETRLLAKLLRRASDIADQLRRLDHGDPRALVEARDALLELRTALMGALGRKS